MGKLSFFVAVDEREVASAAADSVVAKQTMSEKQVKVLANEVYDVSAETVKLSNVVAKKTKKISDHVGGETKKVNEAIVASTQELATNIGTESQKLAENIGQQTKAISEVVARESVKISEVVARESVKVATNVGSTTKAVAEAVVASTVKKAPAIDTINKKEPDTNLKDKAISFADEQEQQEDDEVIEKLAASKSNANTKFRLSKLACAVVENSCGDDLAKAVAEENRCEEEKEKDPDVDEDEDEDEDETRDDITFDWSAADYHSGVDVDELTLSSIPMVSHHEDSDDDDDDDDSTIGSHSTTNSILMLDLGEVQMSSDAEDDVLDTDDAQDNVDGREVTVHDYQAIAHTNKEEAKNTIYSSSTNNVRQIETREGIEVVNSCAHPSDKSDEENEAEDKNSEDAIAADKEGQVEAREDVEDDSAIGIGGQGQIETSDSIEEILGKPHDTGNGCEIETRDSVEEILVRLDEAGNNAQIETREGIEVINSCAHPSDKSDEENEAGDKNSEDAIAADKEGQVETREDVEDDSAIGIGGQGQIHDTGNGCEIETRDNVEEILGRLDEAGNGCHTEKREGIEEVETPSWLYGIKNGNNFETREDVEDNPSPLQQLTDDGSVEDKTVQVKNTEDGASALMKDHTNEEDAALQSTKKIKFQPMETAQASAAIKAVSLLAQTTTPLKPQTARAFAAHVAPSPNELMKRRNKRRRQFQKPSSE